MSNEKRDRKLVKQLATYRVKPKVTFDAIVKFLETLDCPRALAVCLLFKYNEHEQLAALRFDPLDHNTLVGLRDAYAATAFLSKYEDLNLNYDLDARAMEKFESFESLCAQTNYRFMSLAVDPLFKGKTVWLHNATVRKVAEIMGDISFQDFTTMAHWGPGASTLIKSEHASATQKFQIETGITRRLLSLFPVESFRGVYPVWFNHLDRWGLNPTFQAGNKVITVPKDATKNRVIAIEPGFNLWFQQAIGTYIQKRLKRFGIDITDQSRNQQLARLGSKTLKLATVDFSSASDSISDGVVRELFSPRWYTLLDCCRSQCGVDSTGKVRVWNKFSSMGNGFTFGLETVIFYAAALACAEYHQLSSRQKREEVSVYGDDVIIPILCLDSYAELCTFYGFVMNTKKTHFSSCFRESCGEHFYSGADVTPIYLKGRLSDIPSVFRFANAVRRLSHRRNSYFGCDIRFRALFDSLVKSVPKSFRFWISQDKGDGGFISNWDEAAPAYASSEDEKEPFYGSSYSLMRHVVEIGMTYHSEGVGLLIDRLFVVSRGSGKIQTLRGHAFLSASNALVKRLKLREIRILTSGPDFDRGNLVSRRGRTRLKITLSQVAQWYDLGLWQ
jgi:hypothetical protein